MNSAAGDTPPVLSVSALNQAVARLLERSFPLAWISGEVSNFTRAASGHWYFTLKDDTAQVRAVMFRGRAQYADFLPREGDKVEVRALVSLYAARGDFQLGVEAIRRAGVGNLFEAFLQLKARLGKEGLFDPTTKRPIPDFARRIGIVTSPQAAALQDVLSALQRRAPHCEIVVYPTPVQGAGAGVKIAAAITVAAVRNECDVLLICRGGGSIEDLWAFNDELVARALVACPMPVISGVGHETDFTIADFAADLRAPTPTAAAEMATRPSSQWQTQLNAAGEALVRAFRREHAGRCQTLDWIARRLVNPRAHVDRVRQNLQGWQQRLVQANRIPLSTARHALAQLSTRLTGELPDTRSHRLQLSMQARRLSARTAGMIFQQRQSLSSLSTQLELLNPQRTLERGYAIVTTVDDTVVRSPQALHGQRQIDLRLAEGSARINIESIEATTKVATDPA
ncbi:MAG: exodeoxyribonuclease VII large subunit [Pseudomonadota bacterium]